MFNMFGIIRNRSVPRLVEHGGFLYRSSRIEKEEREREREREREKERERERRGEGEEKKTIVHRTPPVGFPVD